MIQFMAGNRLIGRQPRPLWLDQDRKVIAFRTGDFVFIFNFHPTESYPTFELPVHEQAEFQVVLDTDEWRFGGQGRIYHDPIYRTCPLPMNKEYLGLVIYSPCRTAMVLRKISG
jgi:1,4-alpha-glucan branching enzyme